MRWRAYAEFGDFTILEVGKTIADGYRFTLANRSVHLSVWNDVEAFERTNDGERVFVRIQSHRLLHKNRQVVYHSC